MNICIIGPEGSGKTTFAKNIAKAAANGRLLYFFGMLKGPDGFISMPVEKFNDVKNCVAWMDDTNAYFDSHDVYTDDKKYKGSAIMSRHDNRLNIYVFHSMDDTVKFFYRQCRYVYVSAKYRDSGYQKNKFIAGITPELVGKPPYQFWRYKRY